MKQNVKLASLLLALAMCLSICLIGCGEEKITDPVYVTIAVKGEMVLTYQPVSLEDKDGDGALTMNDALIAAHEKHYDSGKDGYTSAKSEYGLSLNKLWGDESGAFGYMLNDASVATSLSEPIKVGDHVYAYVYKDQTAWSDTYCYFDKTTAEVSADGTLTLTLMSAGFDENWIPVSRPIAGAVITINGEAIGATTNEQGQVTFSMGEKSQKDAFIVSAKSETVVMVPPICMVTVK